MNGFVPLLFHPNVSDTAVSNYKALAGASSKATIVKVVQHNMDNQQTTENLLMSTVSFLFAVASTHLCLGERPGIYYYIKKKITAGSQ